MRFISFSICIATALLLGACTQPLVAVKAPKNELWQVTVQKDRFTDKETRMLTFGDFSTSQAVYTSSMNYYPFVGLADGIIFVGVRSGGAIRVPTGTVQIRVDDLPVWTIESKETPIFLSPNSGSAPSTIDTGNAQVNAALAASTLQMTEEIQKMSSPFTAATGDKAIEIIRQMEHGKNIIYRTVGVNQSTSSTGSAQIDQSFLDGLKSLGINTSQ